MALLSEVKKHYGKLKFLINGEWVDSKSTDIQETTNRVYPRARLDEFFLWFRILEKFIELIIKSICHTYPPGDPYSGKVIWIELSFHRRSSQLSMAFAWRIWRIAGSRVRFSSFSKILKI